MIATYNNDWVVNVRHWIITYPHDYYYSWPTFENPLMPNRSLTQEYPPTNQPIWFAVVSCYINVYAPRSSQRQIKLLGCLYVNMISACCEAPGPYVCTIPHRRRLCCFNWAIIIIFIIFAFSKKHSLLTYLSHMSEVPSLLCFSFDRSCCSAYEWIIKTI